MYVHPISMHVTQLVERTACSLNISKPERQQIALTLTLLISMKWLDIVCSTANFTDFELVIMKSKLHVDKLNLLALKETEKIVQNILASDSFQCFKFCYII